MTKLDLIRVALVRAKFELTNHAAADRGIHVRAMLSDIESALDAVAEIGRCFEAPPLELPAPAPAAVDVPRCSNTLDSDQWRNGGQPVKRPEPAPRGPNNGGAAVALPEPESISF